mmetsp:Transcript_45480/g.91770  ORF Transcript_45480/g.91770 Transcript_45480/m.91770 type:complete len:482 (-) Transcript_45480:172-1617(-)
MSKEEPAVPTMQYASRPASRIRHKIAHLFISFLVLVDLVISASADSETILSLSAFPFGVDTGNSTVVDFWTAQPVIPTSRIELHVRVDVGGDFEMVIKSRPDLSLDSDVWLTLRIGADVNRAPEHRLRLAQFFSLNIGATGPMHIDASLSYGEEIIAISSLAFEIAPLGSEFTPHSCLMGAEAREIGTNNDETTPPPVCMPRDLVDAYTMSGRAVVNILYFDDKSDRSEKTYPQYSRDQIESFVQMARNREEYYYGYTDTFLYAALDRHSIRGQTVLIVGSNVPWYESICIAFGASTCVTLEYNELRYEHEDINTVSVAEWSSMRAKGTPCDMKRSPANCRFDSVWSISSFEHDGLGRYGDPINPNADLSAMENLLDNVDPQSGLVFLSVPVGSDTVQWNEGRIYGAERLRLLLARYVVLSTFGVLLSAVASGDGPALVAAQARHARLAPKEAFQPVLVLAPSGIGGGAWKTLSSSPTSLS